MTNISNLERVRAERANVPNHWKLVDLCNTSNQWYFSHYDIVVSCIQETHPGRPIVIESAPGNDEVKGVRVAGYIMYMLYRCDNPIIGVTQKLV